METESGAPQCVWCPGCASLITQRGDGIATCEACGVAFDVGLAVRASEQWRRKTQLDGSVAALDKSIDDMNRRRLSALALAEAADARAGQLRGEALAVAVEPQPTVEAAAGAVSDAPNVKAARRSAHPPIAFLLQGTGAVLVLAALVAVSAVLWGSLSGGMQVTLLLSAVFVIGVLAVLTKRPVPTTSTVLAALTLAALVVVLLAAPTLIDSWQSPLYVGAAAAAFTTSALLGGFAARVRLWWFAGIASIPITVLSAVLSVTATSQQLADSRWNLTLVVAFVAPVAVGLAWWSAKAVDRDPGTARTAWWTAIVTVVLGWLVALAAVASVMLLAFDPDFDRLPPMIELLLLGSATLAIWSPGNVTGFWRGGALRGIGAIWVAAGASTAFLVSPPSAIAAIAVGSSAAAVVGIGLALGDRLGSWRTAALAGVGTFAALLWAAQARAAIDGQIQVVAAPQFTWMWLAALVFGLLVAGLLLAKGLWQRVPALIVVGIPVAAIAWWLGYATGLADRFPGDLAYLPAAWIEFLWWPAAALALVVLALAHRRGMFARISMPAAVVIAVTPSWIVSLGFVLVQSPTVDVVTLRTLAVISILALMTALIPRSQIAFSTVVLGMAAFVPWLVWTREFAAEALELPEVLSVPTAFVAAVLIAWVKEPRTSVGQWWRVVRWPLLGVAGVAAVWAVADPFPGGEPVAQIRVVAVVLAAVAVLLLNWKSNPWVAMVAGWVGLAVVWVNWLDWVPADAQWALELRTLPSAVALAGVIGLVVHARRASPNSRPLSSWVTFAPPVLVALIPTAVAAVFDLANDESLVRFWLVVVAGGALVAVGAVRRLVGVLAPSLLALVIVVAPVLFDVIQSLPIWVPLALVGVALLGIGARFEHVRRSGHDLAGWIAHLH